MNSKQPPEYFYNSTIEDRTDRKNTQIRQIDDTR